MSRTSNKIALRVVGTPKTSIRMDKNRMNGSEQSQRFQQYSSGGWGHSGGGWGGHNFGGFGAKLGAREAVDSGGDHHGNN